LNLSKMQRALTSRASTLGRSSTSKLRPIASAGFNAQQLRFAHKVCNT
jgi:chaperonin GroEL